MPFLAQYSRRVTPLFANPSTILRISSLLRIPPFSAESSHANKMGSSDAYSGADYQYEPSKKFPHRWMLEYLLGGILPLSKHLLTLRVPKGGLPPLSIVLG